MRRKREPKWLKAARSADQADQRADQVAKLDWIARALARAGVLLGAQADSALRSGRVRVAGKVVREPFTPCPVGALVEVDGRRVDVTPRTLVLAFHKPKGLIVAGHDEEGLGTVFEALTAALPAELAGYGWLGVGRLDRDTTGVLLFTNDEQFVEHATSPSTHLPKRYLVTVSGQVTEEKLSALRTGVEFEGRVSRPASASLRRPGVLELVLTEGKFHQVKRMMNAVNLATLSLHREAVGRYELDVPEGALRKLTDDEVRSLLDYTPR